MPFAFVPWAGRRHVAQPPMPLFFAPLAAVALGIARGAIDDLVALAATKTPTAAPAGWPSATWCSRWWPGPTPLTRSARAFLLETLDGLQAAVREADSPDPRRRPAWPW